MNWIENKHNNKKNDMGSIDILTQIGKYCHRNLKGNVDTMKLNIFMMTLVSADYSSFINLCHNKSVNPYGISLLFVF